MHLSKHRCSHHEFHWGSSHTGSRDGCGRWTEDAHSVVARHREGQRQIHEESHQGVKDDITSFLLASCLMENLILLQFCTKFTLCVCCSITRLLLTERPLMVTSSTCTLVHWTRRVCWRWSAAPTIQGTHTNILTYEHSYHGINTSLY